MTADLAVLVGFLLFLGIVFYYRVPSMIGGMLDKRAQKIEEDLEEARKAREEAQKLLAKIERDTAGTEKEAEKIVENARKDAQAAAEQAKQDLRETIDRKMKAAEDRIDQAEASAIRRVRNAAANAAVIAASSVLNQEMDESKANEFLDDGIETVADRLH